MPALTMTAKELAVAIGCSDWAIYQAVKEGTCPVPPIRVGNRIVFARSAVERLLELEPGSLDEAAS